MTRHSQLDNLYPQAFVEINPADASLMGIDDRQVVRVSSRRGSIVLQANVSEKTTAGVVFIPFHFAEAAANLLTIDALDPEAKIPEFKACAGKIEPAREESGEVLEAGEARGRY
jgi:predicted molibdopterin-dependent oxidoreductase YjgC